VAGSLVLFACLHRRMADRPAYRRLASPAPSRVTDEGRRSEAERRRLHARIGRILTTMPPESTPLLSESCLQRSDHMPLVRFPQKPSVEDRLP